MGQSADNQLLTYSANDRVRPNRKKTFKGHAAAGYACQPAFSHDDHYVISGDGEGKLFVWDWKTTKVRLGRRPALRLGRRCAAAALPLRCAAVHPPADRPCPPPPLQILRSLKAHDGVCIGAEWHPTESSKVATCGWDGLVKYWD